MIYDRGILKERAKLAMAQARPRVWVVTLVFLALSVLVPGVIQQVVLMGAGMVDFMMGLARVPMLEVSRDMPSAQWVAGATAGRLILFSGISYVLSIVIALFRTVMGYGYQGYALRVYRGEQAGVGDVFGGFSRLGTVLGSAIMVGVFTWLWMMLMILVSLVVGVLIGLAGEYLPTAVTVLALVALVVVDVVWGVWITCRYTLTPYFVMSRPDMGVFAAIRASKQGMKGNIIRRVGLSLSFLGWYMLMGLIALTVGAVGAMVEVLLLSDSIDRLLRLAGRDYVDPHRVLYLLEGMAPMLIIGLAITVVVAALACLPLRLWLMGYENVAYAGFFQHIVGGAFFPGATPWTAPAPTPPAAPVTPPPAAPVTAETAAPPAGVEVRQAPPAVAVEEKPYDPFGGEGGLE